MGPWAKRVLDDVIKTLDVVVIAMNFVITSLGPS